MGQLIEVMYTVPVACIVDIEEGVVVEVAVFDEELEQDGTFADADGEPLGSEAAEVAERAQAIAEDSGIIWPAWNFGRVGRIGFKNGGPTVESQYPDVVLDEPTRPRISETMRFHKWLRERGWEE